MESINYYEILGVSEKASPAEITAAKNQLAKKYHPDVNMKNGIDTTEQMQQILLTRHLICVPILTSLSGSEQAATARMQ